MLKTTLIHPEILGVLARAGHHAKIVIADGNYPASTTMGPHATLVSLNLSPGVVTVNQVLAAILSTVPINHIHTMGIPADDPYAKAGEPPVWKDYAATIAAAGLSVPLTSISKWDFYEAVISRDHVLTIQTADTALWANLLLEVGVREV